MGSYFRDYYSPKSSQRPSVGDTKMSVVGTDHMGWLVCDGRTVSTTSYNLLFQVIGYRFGGSGANFTLPDMRGRVPGAAGTGSGLTARAIAAVVGEETHTLTINEMPAHRHGSTDVTGATDGDGVTATNGAHVHTGQTNESVDTPESETVALNGVGTAQVSGSNPRQLTFTTASAGAHNHTIGSTGGGQSHNNMQPTLFLGNTFIYCGKPLNGPTAYFGNGAVIL